MIKSILLVLDGQAVDHGSVDLAIRWSLEFDALLIALGVIDESAVSPAEATPIGAGEAKRERDAARLHERQVDIESALSAIALRCAQAHVAFKPLENIGRSAEEIAVEAQRFDVILMARRLDQQLTPQEWSISDSLHTILRLAPRPVIAAPEQPPSGEAIVIAFDGSLQAARTLYAFVASGMADDRSVHVASFHEEPLVAARTGNRAVEFMAAHGIKATLFARGADRPVVQILDYARDVDAGLLVLGAYGKPWIREFFLGSVTSAVLAKSPVPLFLFH